MQLQVQISQLYEKVPYFQYKDYVPVLQHRSRFIVMESWWWREVTATPPPPPTSQNNE